MTIKQLISMPAVMLFLIGTVSTLPAQAQNIVTVYTPSDCVVEDDGATLDRIIIGGQIEPLSGSDSLAVFCAIQRHKINTTAGATINVYTNPGQDQISCSGYSTRPHNSTIVSAATRYTSGGAPQELRMFVGPSSSWGPYSLACRIDDGLGSPNGTSWGEIHSYRVTER